MVTKRGVLPSPAPICCSDGNPDTTFTAMDAHSSHLKSLPARQSRAERPSPDRSSSSSHVKPWEGNTAHLGQVMAMSQQISPETQSQTLRTSKMEEHNPAAALTPPRQALEGIELSWDRQSHSPMAGGLMIPKDPKGSLQHPKNMKTISQNRSSKEITDGVIQLAQESHQCGLGSSSIITQEISGTSKILRRLTGNDPRIGSLSTLAGSFTEEAPQQMITGA